MTEQTITAFGIVSFSILIQILLIKKYFVHLNRMFDFFNKWFCNLIYINSISVFL